MDSEFTVSVNAWRKGGAGVRRIGDVRQGQRARSSSKTSCAAWSSSPATTRRSPIAEGISGTEENFARLMTDRARADRAARNRPSVTPPGTATRTRRSRSANLRSSSLHVIETYPEYYKMFGEKEFTWNKIRQLNRNPLLTMDIGADGLKTGNVDESGYGLVGLGGPERPAPRGRGQRAEDRPRSCGRVPQASGMGLPLLRAAACCSSRERCVGEAEVFGGDRRSLSARLRAAGPCTHAARGRRAALRAHRLSGPAQGPHQEGGPGGATRGHPRRHKGARNAALCKRGCQVGTLHQRAFDGLLEVSTGWVRRALSDVFSGI